MCSSLAAAALPPAGPLRRLAAGSLITNVGNGAWYATWAIFLTRSVGLSSAQVGLGMTLAGALGMALATPVGHLADRLGPREVLAVLLVLQALGTAGFAAVHGFASFLGAAGLAVTAGQVTGGARGALVVGLADGAERVRTLSSLRTVGHVGWAVGAAIGAGVLALDSRGAYLGMVALDAASYLACAAALAGVPRVPPAAVPDGGPRPAVLRDGPYVSLAALMGVLALCWGMLSTGLPLWVTAHTQAPRWIVAVIVGLNSAAIAALQLRVSRSAGTPRAAARVAARAGAALALACALVAVTGGRGGLVAVALLLAAGAAHVAGELLFVSASWGLSLPLMPAGAPGQYQGMFATGEATAISVAPVLMTTLVVGAGAPGWLALAGIFAAAGAAATPATAWALRRRGTPAAAASAALRNGAPGAGRGGS
jgi:MFS transporter